MAAAKAVTSAVASVEAANAALLDDQGYHRGAHAAEFGVGLRTGVDGFVGGEDGLVDHFLERHVGSAAGEQAHEFIDSEGTGYLPGRRAAHAVADEIDAVLSGVAECIFVGEAFAAPVGYRRSRIVDDSRGQLETPLAKFTRVS